MVMGGPVRPSAYGSPWYLFERRFGLPFTALAWDRLAATDLRGYRVLILPDGSYPDPESDPRAGLVLDHLEEWTDRGGVLITMRGRFGMARRRGRLLDPDPAQARVRLEIGLHDRRRPPR